ncbi:MAG: O-acetylhomoserine aminocarboxypropyltransferase/cysteine synthase [Clostridiales bacterium]|jgi:O-acetylhomoserine (thiol)-lyase|nr:O-acetylhomoserine aminocarboxypropyltransferase/cysteine synthase [Clostridiales bacterium]
MSKYRFETLSIHGGYTPEATTHANVPPIYMTTAYSFDDVEHARRLFALEEGGNIYTRLQNPTNTAFEKRISLLEGGVDAVAASSGHAAITMALLTLCRQGDEVVSSTEIYGGAINLLDKTFARMGITVRFAEISEPESFARLINDKTRAVFIESIGNPKADIADIRAIADIAHKSGIPLIVDNTFATPYLLKPIEHGADIVIHSTTKYLAGNGTSMGGAIVDSGNFEWKGNPRFTEFNEPDPSYHGVVYSDAFGRAAFAARVRTQILRDIGACQSPFNSWVTMLGMETLALRMERHSSNALKVAEFLDKHPAIERVDYPGLKSSRYYELAKRYLPNGASGVFTFEIKGGREAGARFVNRLKLFRIVANLGDARSMVSHPATTTHSQLSDEQLVAAGISASTIRLSIGLENIGDIVEDLQQALS